MPRGSRKILLSIFDAQPTYVLEALAGGPKSFTEVQMKTKLPKATLHRTLKNLVNDKLVKKARNLYVITSDGSLLLELFERLQTRSELKTTDDSIRRVLEQARRTARMESLGFGRIEQFESIQEAVESVEVVEVPS